MKTSAFIIAASIASASAFAPSTRGAPSTTALSAEKEKKSFFSTVFGMDLFAPNADVNDYGSRSKKNVSVG